MLIFFGPNRWWGLATRAANPSSHDWIYLQIEADDTSHLHWCKKKSTKDPAHQISSTAQLYPLRAYDPLGFHAHTELR